MIIHFVLIIQTIIHGYYSQAPDSACSTVRPFESSDKTCGNFIEICVKKDDLLCNNFQAACKQCPPTNYTVSMLIFMKNQIDSSNQKIISLKGLIIFLVVSIIIIFIVIFVIIMLFLTPQKKHHIRYAIVKRRKRKYDLETKINQSIEILNRKFDSKFEEIIGKIDHLQTPSKDIKFATIQFQFDDIDQKPIELYVHNNHNIVQVKQQICAKLPHAKPEDYKIMKLKYNGIILNDDNQYLLENIDKSNAIVNCFIDSSKNASDIVVVKLQGKMRLPDIIQINKNQTIDQLKELIGKIINLKEFSLFKEILDDKKQMKKSLLKLDSACLEKELIDGDCIRIIQTIEGELTIKSIFNENVSIAAAYKNTNQISTLIESVKNDYTWDPNNFVLFYNNQYLNENKYICEYDICTDSPVKICNLAKMVGINKHDRCEGYTCWELFHATKPPNNMEILLKKYKNITLENWKSQDWMINELKTFLITEKHPRFIQLFGVYFDDTLYVAMENMEKGTLKFYLKNNRSFKKKLIYKWSKQILEGLEYLHKNNVVHRDLNPSNILVNNNIDLKLSSFNLSKYENIYGPSSFNDKPQLLTDVKVRYMAPELLNGKEYKFPCDIWSFGAVLLRIASGKKPLPKMCKEEVKIHIINNGIDEYNLSDKYESDPKLKSMIDSCLKRNPDERCKIENLLKD